LSDISSLELGRYDDTNSQTAIQETMKQYINEQIAKNNQLMKEDLQKKL
jgi:hypothetical protein